MDTEADTCRKYVVPNLVEAGWDNEPHSIAEQRTFTDGRIIVTGDRIRRRKAKRADYILRYTRDIPLAIVEAKAEYKKPGDGMQQAKEYAEILDLKFAYSSNGPGILEFDFTTGVEQEVENFPTPDELWGRLLGSPEYDRLDEEQIGRYLTPSYQLLGKTPRYYQEIAINRSICEVLKGNRRILLTMATGTGKTLVAYHICWRLWQSRWNRTGEYRKSKILYISDRNILIDDPKDKTFIPFGEARHKIEHGKAIKSR